MSRYEEELDAEIVARKVIFGNTSHVNLRSLCRGRINLDCMLKEIGDRNHLRMVTLDINLFHFAGTECCNRLTEEIFVEDRILLQIRGRTKAHEHDDVVCLGVVGEHAQKVPVDELGI